MQYEDSESEHSIDEETHFKKLLFQSFKKAGVIDNVKATLRKQLCDKLVDKTQTDQEKKEKQDQEHETNRFFYERKLVAYMLADFLRQHDINYTYSVFLPEMKLESEHILSKREILDALSVKQYEYKNLIQMNMDKELSAIEILMEVVRQVKRRPKTEVHCQTETEYEKPMQYKMDDVAREAKDKMDKINISAAKNYEEQIRKLRADLERRYQEQLEEEIQRVRDYELTEIRAQETDSFQQKLRKHKYDMDKIYEDKLVRLKERERTALELCKRRQQDLEKIAFEQRQQHIKEIENLREQELEMRKHNCMETDDIKNEQEKIKKLEAQLKLKIRDYDQAKLSIQTSIEKDIQQRRKLMKKEQEMEREGLNLQTKNEDSEMIKQHRENLSMLEQQRQYLQRDLDVTRRDNKELEFIKDQQQKEIAALRSNLESFREEINAYQERVHNSEERANKASKQVELLQDQLNSHKEFQSTKQIQHEALHKTYSEDVQKYQTKSMEVEKYYYNKLQDMTEKHRFEILGYKNQTQRLESTVDKLQDESDNLRAELRYLRRQQNVEKNRETIQEKYEYKEKIEHEIDDLGNQEFQSKINKTQEEMKQFKQKYLDDLNSFENL